MTQTTTSTDTRTRLELKLETKVDSRGGIVLPAIVRQDMGLAKGDPVLIELKDGILKITSLSNDLTE